MKKSTRKYYLMTIIGIFLAFVFLESMGVFDSKSWFEVPHGSHSHYLPKNYKECNPPLGVSQAPTRPPDPGQTVNCQGQIVDEL